MNTPYRLGLWQGSCRQRRRDNASRDLPCPTRAGRGWRRRRIEYWAKVGWDALETRTCRPASLPRRWSPSPSPVSKPMRTISSGARKSSLFPSGADRQPPGQGGRREHGGGGNERFPGAVGSAVTRVFDLTIARVGIGEEAARREDIPYRSVESTVPSKVDYFVGNMPLWIQVLFRADDHRCPASLAVRSALIY